MKAYPPGTRIGQYAIAGRPLMGGMGIVYVCNDLEADRPVALKTFKPEYLPDRAARDRFLREGTAWVDLGRHPHIVRCYEVLHTDPEVYLVLELVAKEQGRDDASLRAWLTPGRPLPAEQALLFGLQIVRGMAHATAALPGFVHRDLKPENVLVGADRLPGNGTNRLRVTDFGLAVVLQAAASRLDQPPPGDAPSPISNTQYPVPIPLGRTQLTHGIVGTPLYMAPEQWRGEEVTVQTDVYALGCILFEMVTGQRAVTGRSLAALERAHCQGKVRPLPRELPSAIKEVVTGCLAREPRSRYSSWNEVEAALMSAYAAVTGQTAPGPAPAETLSHAERVAAGWSYNAMGVSYLDIAKSRVALTYFERAWDVGQTERDQRLKAASLTHQGMAHDNLGQARQAIDLHQQARRISSEVGDERGERDALGNLGNAYLSLGQARQAIDFYERALAMSRQIDDPAGEGHVLDNLGLVYVELGDIQEAIDYHKQALAIASNIDNRRGQANALGNLGSAYFAWGEMPSAIEFFQRQLDISRSIGDRRGEGNALGGLGQAYVELGDSRRAIGFCEQHLDIAREIGHRQGEGTALSNLGKAYAALGDVWRAIDYLKQAIQIDRDIEDLLGQGMDSANLAMMLMQAGQVHEALSWAEQAVRAFQEAGAPHHAQQAQQLAAAIQAELR
jgi:serine/threonine protein kinase